MGILLKIVGIWIAQFIMLGMVSLAIALFCAVASGSFVGFAGILIPGLFFNALACTIAAPICAFLF